jgi:hypothetical protein
MAGIDDTVLLQEFGRLRFRAAGRFHARARACVASPAGRCSMIARRTLPRQRDAKVSEMCSLFAMRDTLFVH